MKEPIRILQHVRVLDSGGIEAFIFANLRRINREKVVFDFLVTRDKQEFYEDEVEKLGGKKIVLKFKKFNNSLLDPISQAIAFYKFCKKNKDTYHVIHFQSIGANGFLDIIAAKVAGIPYRIAHSHIANDIKPSHNSKSKKINKLRKKFVLLRQSLIRIIVSNFSTHYFGCSKMACEWMYTKKLNEQGKCIVVNNPIDTSKFIFNNDIRNKYRRKLGIDNKFVIGHVGRFVYSKNHQFLIDIFVEILKKEKDSILLLVGEGNLKSDIQEKVNELGLNNNVIFYGETNEINQVYNAFDTFVFPSHYEGLGIVLVEAQANGLPIVASDSIPSEVKLTSNFNFISLNNEPQKWAEKILEYKDSRNIKNYQNVINAGYDIKDVAKFLEEKYIELS